MAFLAEIEAQAMELTDSQRAKLAASLLGSLPALLYDDGEGLAEAALRDAEMENDSSICMTTQQLNEALGRLHNGYHLGGKPQTRSQTSAR